MFALIENNQIVDRRLTPGEGDWRPLVSENRQPFDPELETERVEIYIEPDRVRQVYSIVPRPISSFDVDVERDRRQSTFSFNGHDFNFEETSRIDIAGAGSLAQGAIAAGAQAGNLRWVDPAADFYWISAQNERVYMDAQTCFAFAQVAAQWRAAHVYAARALKDMTPIPTDYKSDTYWP